jgi:hypothetical protein
MHHKPFCVRCKAIPAPARFSRRLPDKCPTFNPTFPVNQSFSGCRITKVSFLNAPHLHQNNHAIKYIHQ